MSDIGQNKKYDEVHLNNTLKSSFYVTEHRVGWQAVA
jgi:hypothetical protein